MGLGNFAEKLKQLIQGSRGISEDFFEHLEDYLVEGDLGAQESVLVVEKLRLRCKKEGLSDTGEVRQLLARILVEELDPLYKNQSPLLNPEERGIFLILGVNGVGKTTSCAKLAARYQKEGRKVILAAADTFRAGAIDQLKIHGERYTCGWWPTRVGGIRRRWSTMPLKRPRPRTQNWSSRIRPGGCTPRPPW